MNGTGFAFPHLYLSAPRGEGLPAARWAHVLLRERELRVDAPKLSRPLRSLFVGGEMPESLGPELPERVREVVGREALGGVAEWTVELSDPRIDESVISGWIAGGVTRLSLRGPAAAPSSVGRLADLCRGRTALGVDVRLSTGGALGVQDRITELIVLGAGSLSFVEPDVSVEPALEAATGSAAGSAAEVDVAAGADAEGTRETWLAAVEAVHRAGWRFLDLAFAHGAASCPLHPRAIARRNPVLGLGPGAVTFRHPARRWNHADPHSYLAAIENRRDPLAGGESLTRAEGRFERCWASLRSARGLRLPSPSCAATPWFERWQAASWVRSGAERVEPTDRLRLAPEGWLVSDGLAVELALELERIPPGGSTDHPEFQNFEE